MNVFDLNSDCLPSCLIAFSRASRQDYGAVDPGFTMRRKMEHLREEREQIRQLRSVGTIIHCVGAVLFVCSVPQTFILKASKLLKLFKGIPVVVFLPEELM